MYDWTRGGDWRVREIELCSGAAEQISRIKLSFLYQEKVRPLPCVINIVKKN